MPKPLPSLAYLRDHFIYSADLGILLWRANGHVAGSKDKRGRLSIGLGGKYYYVHRIIWKMMTGDEPPDIIDHVDGNNTNNRWVNLRIADFNQSSWNTRRKLKHPLPRGVKLSNNKPGRYEARSRNHGKYTYLGIFNTPEEAHAAFVAHTKTIRGKFFQSG